MKLIVGLGNPGEQYGKTRHNVGFLAVDELAKDHELVFRERPKFKSLVAEGEIAGEKVILAKPHTFMNECGLAVRLLVDWHKLKQSDVLVIHDDADMEFGKLRLISRGSDGGHNGVVSLQEHGLDDIWRLKIGVANQHRLPGQAIDFVLTKFEKTEWNGLGNIFGNTINQIINWINKSE